MINYKFLLGQHGYCCDCESDDVTFDTLRQARKHTKETGHETSFEKTYNYIIKPKKETQ